MSKEPDQTPPSPPMGMPIYEDDQDRSIVDALDEDGESPDWYPSNATALKLWQCLEALRDIDAALAGLLMQGAEVQRRRQLKQFSVPLHSLATTVVRLCDQIAGDADAKFRLEAGTVSQVSKIRTEFCGLIPFDHKGDLSVIRNRLGGHVDRELAPWTAREILSREAMSNFGKWLHICLHALLDLLKLDVYSWSVHSPVEDCIRLMSEEPFLVTFLKDGGQMHLAAIHVVKRSPREAVSDLIGKIVANSQWMFDEFQPRIRSLKIDQSGEWNTFRGCSAAIWNPPPK